MNKDRKNRIVRILSLFSKNRFSPETEEDIHKWLIAEEDREEKKEASFQQWNAMKPMSDDKEEMAFERINKKIGVQNKDKFVLRRFLYIAAVLIPLFILSVGLVFFAKDKDNTVEVITAYGEIRQIVLPDGSEVRLQPGSTLTYPAKFKADKRILSLDGEGLFTVTKDEQKPFIVKTNTLEVHVVGTIFNMHAYSEEDRIITTLLEGKVNVYTEGNEIITLNPDQQLVYDRVTTETFVRELTHDSITNTQKAQLFFDDSSLSEILHSIERRFNVQVKPDPSALKERYTIKFHEKDNLNAIINVLNETVDDYSFQSQGGEISFKEKEIVSRKEGGFTR